MTVQDMKILVMGDNRCWGKGDTVAEALANARKPKRYIAYICHPKTQVDEMGYICTPARKTVAGRQAVRPKEILRKGIPYEQPAKM